MESCLLCLEINKDFKDSIRANSIQWQKLNIAKVIEKHFWLLSTINSCSWICLSCWHKVDDFHKFYMRIRDAHTNFGKIKLENEVECKEEFTIQKINIKGTPVESDKDNLTFCFLEPEILLDQIEDLKEPEILTEQTAMGFIEKENSETECLYEINLEESSLKETYKSLRLQNELSNEDPLQKYAKSKDKFRNRKNPKEEASTKTKLTEGNNGEESKVKEEPMDINDYEHAFDSENDNDFRADKNSSETADNRKQKQYSKHHTTLGENDKFIAEYFKQIFCDICQEQFDDFPTIQKHFIKNHKQRGYIVCCKRKFFVRTRLIDHIHSHLNSDRKSFESNLLLVHKANKVVKQHCCDVCGKSFIKASALRIHKLRTHLPEEEKKFSCNDCGKKFGSPYILNQHRQTVHLKRFVKICYICGKSINSSTEFKVHIKKHEGIPAPVISCDICGLLLTTERGLKRHKDSQHPVGGKREHPCPICPKISPTLKALRKHINTMHKKGVDHKCSICEKAFKRSVTLKEHMASHTGITLYTCPWCPKTFNSNGNMHAHRKKKHPKEYEESKLQKYLTVI